MDITTAGGELISMRLPSSNATSSANVLRPSLPRLVPGVRSVAATEDDVEDEQAG